METTQFFIIKALLHNLICYYAPYIPNFKITNSVQHDVPDQSIFCNTS